MERRASRDSPVSEFVPKPRTGRPRGEGTGAQGQTPMTQVFIGASPGLESIAMHREGPTSVEATGERVRILAIMAQNRGGG